MDRIGRYQVLGDLRSGGMAQLLLARVVGPSGFERLVVIKRILPGFATKRDYVEMFLDEARTVARINHPNVVHVYELNQSGELYLAMEYLNGEDALGLLTRLNRRGERLDPALACHVVAEAARGLHAAHELRDEEDLPLDIVHRDVTPANIFVTYDGAIKLLDFGIARVADRTTRTQAGVIKGKYSYMAPEQIAGRELDRRCDVWALGVVLTELVTGQKLFGGENVFQIADAICKQPIPRPSELRAGLPPSFDRVSDRALQRDRSRRYATALEMRADVLRIVADLASKDEPEVVLSQLMRDVFSDRIEEKRDFLRRARGASSVGRVPVARIDDDVDLPTATTAVSHAEEAAPAPREPAAEPTGMESVTTFADSGLSRRRRLRTVAVATGAGCIVAAVAFGLRGPPARTAEGSSAVSARPVQATPQLDDTGSAALSTPRAERAAQSAPHPPAVSSSETASPSSTTVPIRKAPPRVTSLPTASVPKVNL